MVNIFECNAEQGGMHEFLWEAAGRRWRPGRHEPNGGATCQRASIRARRAQTRGPGSHTGNEILSADDSGGQFGGPHLTTFTVELEQTVLVQAAPDPGPGDQPPVNA